MTDQYSHLNFFSIFSGLALSLLLLDISAIWAYNVGHTVNRPCTSLTSSLGSWTLWFPKLKCNSELWCITHCQSRMVRTTWVFWWRRRDGSRCCLWQPVSGFVGAWASDRGQRALHITLQWNNSTKHKSQWSFIMMSYKCLLQYEIEMGQIKLWQAVTSRKSIVNTPCSHMFLRRSYFLSVCGKNMDNMLYLCD